MTQTTGGQETRRNELRRGGQENRRNYFRAKARTGPGARSQETVAAPDLLTSCSNRLTRGLLLALRPEEMTSGERSNGTGSEESRNSCCLIS